MKTLICLAAVIGAGCGEYARVQGTLLEQARRGVAQVRVAAADRSGLVEEYYALRRAGLDAAFDQDVRERGQRSGGVDAEWVIEHRRAYAAALDGLAEARAKTAAAGQIEQRNLEAIGRAIARVQWLQSIQSQWMGVAGEVDRGSD